MHIRQNIDYYLKNILVALMGIMVLNVVWQVITRFILGSPSSFTDELARFLLIWVGVLGSAYASGKNMHVAIDLLTAKLNAQAKRALATTIALMIVLFVLAVFVIGGARLVYITFLLKQNSAALQIPLAYVYSIIPVSGLLIIYYKLSDTFSR